MPKARAQDLERTGATAKSSPARGMIVGEPTSTGASSSSRPIAGAPAMQEDRRPLKALKLRPAQASSSGSASSSRSPSPAPIVRHEWPQLVEVYSHDKSCCYEYVRGPNLARFDVREFRDSPSNHDGRHYGIQESLLCKEYKFLMLCSRVKAHMRRHRGDRCSLAFYCNRGKHRSVAVAEIMFSLVSSLADCEIEHVSLDYHKHGCNCGACSRQMVTRTVHERALTIWNRAA